MENLLEARDKRTEERKRAKEDIDKAITLSVTEETNIVKLSAKKYSEKVRLLDEGALVFADGSLDSYIEKGTIEKYLNGENEYLPNIDDSYEGTINIGHNNFATFPFLIGKWGKSDLTLTDNGEGRHGLDVNLNLNEDSIFVQEMKRQDYSLGVSVEMYVHYDEEQTKELNAPIIDEICITDFAIVGECGNVGSSDSVQMEGVKGMSEKVDIERIEEDIKETENVATEAAEDVTEVSEDAETVESEEDSEDEETEEEESAEEVDETDDEEVEEDEETVSEEDEAETVSKVLESMQNEIDRLTKENKELVERADALSCQNRRLQKKLKSVNENIEKFDKRFHGLSSSMGLGEKKEKKVETIAPLYSNGGIGE